MGDQSAMQRHSGYVVRNRHSEPLTNPHESWGVAHPAVRTTRPALDT